MVIIAVIWLYRNSRVHPLSRKCWSYSKDSKFNETQTFAPLTLKYCVPFKVNLRSQNLCIEFHFLTYQTSEWLWPDMSQTDCFPLKVCHHVPHVTLNQTFPRELVFLTTATSLNQRWRMDFLDFSVYYWLTKLRSNFFVKGLVTIKESYW